MKRQFSPVLNI